MTNDEKQAVVVARVRAVMNDFNKEFGDDFVEPMWRVVSRGVETKRPDLLKKRLDEFALSDLCDVDHPLGKTGTPANELPADLGGPQMLWMGLYAASVIYLAGETAAGKNTYIYNLLVHAAQNITLWDIEFALGRPLRIWYLDAENGNLLARSKMERIGIGLPGNLVIDAAEEVNLSDPRFQRSFVRRVLDDKFDLVVLDPQANLFRIVNENDNSEAAAQMTWLQSAARKTGAAIILIHHTGKAETSLGAYGRGAAARLGGADVGLTWRSRGGSEDNDDTWLSETGGADRIDECRLEITKNRFGRRGSLYLRMAGSDRFELSSAQAWKAATGKGTANPDRKSKSDLATEAITDLVQEGGWIVRSDILAALKEQDIGTSSADQALKQLHSGGLLSASKVPGGKALAYALKEWAVQQEELEAADLETSETLDSDDPWAEPALQLDAYEPLG